jgi:hypothetical protein
MITAFQMTDKNKLLEVVIASALQNSWLTVANKTNRSGDTQP